MRVTEQLENIGGVSSSNLAYIFNSIAADGIKELELTQKEYYCFITIFYSQIKQDADVAGGEFMFWGIKIKRI